MSGSERGRADKRAFKGSLVMNRVPCVRLGPFWPRIDILQEAGSLKHVILFIVPLMFLAAGCGYQKAPMKPDPYTQSTFLGNDWPIGDGKPDGSPDLETLSGTVEMQE